MSWWSTATGKALFLRQLAERAGHPTGSADPFNFDGRRNNWRANLGQLEAIAEFYVNFKDPWRPNNVPLAPGDAGYETVSFRDPAGSAATILPGNVVKLDGDAPLTHIRTTPIPHGDHLYDTLYLEADERRTPTKRYRITHVDPVNRTVTIDPAPPNRPPGLPAVGAGPPTFAAGTTESKWRISRRPFLLLIDPVGARVANGVVLRGVNARVARQDVNGRDVLSLDGNPDLSKLDVNFDTIYLAADTKRGPHTPYRAYRVVARDNAAAKEVTIDGNVTLANQSTWHIPAGVGGPVDASGEVPNAIYNLGPGGPLPNPNPGAVEKGFDHYDGVLFVIWEGIVQERFRWTSYTSRSASTSPNAAPANWSPNESSIRGNYRYDYRSFVSDHLVNNAGADFRNYSLQITDPGLNPNGIDPAYDGVQEARYYFRTPVAQDVTGGPGGANSPGKTAIRIHFGNQGAGGGGTGSAGCVVSSNYYALRDVLIERYQAEYAAFHGPGAHDAEVSKAHSATMPVGAVGADVHARSMSLWNNSFPAPGAGAAPNKLTYANWTSKFAGELWVIRPDELPLP